MWIKDNITRTGKEVFYESKLINRIKQELAICPECEITKRILDLIKSYEGERW